MPTKRKAETHHASQIERLLHQAGAEHIRVRSYGSTLIIESGPNDDPVRHFRLCRDTVHLWHLDMAGRGRKWDSTPFRDSLNSLATLVLQQFPWVLTPLA